MALTGMQHVARNQIHPTGHRRRAAAPDPCGPALAGDRTAVTAGTRELRTRFRAWVDCLLDPWRPPVEQRQAAYDWCEWGLGMLGIDEHDAAHFHDAFFTDARLATGKAISPLGAARCLREYRRTAVFLQALDSAIGAARVRFPGETIHVVEAGCGPLAPLAFAFAERHPPEDAVFTVLDLHPSAIDGTRRIAEALGVTRSIRAFRVDDAATVRFTPAERPHIVVGEVLLRALTKEPQVAVTCNLAPQLLPGGFFLPQRIDVDAALQLAPPFAAARQGSGGSAFDAGAPHLAEIGHAFSLEAERVGELERNEGGRFKANRLHVPAHDHRRTPLRLFTRIRVFGEHQLGDYDSSLNLPQNFDYPDALAVAGGKWEFAYETSSAPGLRLESVMIDADPVHPFP